MPANIASIDEIFQTNNSDDSNTFDSKRLHPLEDLDLIIPFDQWTSSQSSLVLADKDKLERLLSEVFHNTFLTGQQFYWTQQGAYQIKEGYYRPLHDLINATNSDLEIYCVESCYRNLKSLFDCNDLFDTLCEQAKKCLTTSHQTFFLTERESTFFSSHEVIPCKLQTQYFSALALLTTDHKKLYISYLEETSPTNSAQRLIQSICKINEVYFPCVPQDYLFINVDIPTASKILCCSEIKIENLITNRQLKAHIAPHSSITPPPPKIPLYELLVLLKNDSEKQFHTTSEELKKIITEEFAQKYNATDPSRNFFLGPDESSALRLKINELSENITSLVEQIDAISKMTSVKKMETTLRVVIPELVTLIEEKQDSPHKKWTEDEFMQRLNALEDGDNYKKLNNSLAKNIYKLLPQKFRSGRGEHKKNS